MQRLCRITVPELSIESDFTAARERILSDFPNVHEVVATTAPGTLLLVYAGADEADAWYSALLDSIATRHVSARPRIPRWRGEELAGGDASAA
jgi:hypothetical protein